MGEPKRTPFYQSHIKYGGKLIDFGGWALPVQYSGIIDEHHKVRKEAGLFDVSHMGEVTVEGENALAFLQYLVANDVARLEIGQILYTHMLYPTGGTVDDLLVYRTGEKDYLLVINAANLEKDWNWIQEQAAKCENVKVANVSDDMAELALQGPKAEPILQKLTDYDLSSIKYYWLVKDINIDGVKCLVSRTGYTGEDGFEIFCAPGDAEDLWEKVMGAGEEFGLAPTGLGCRDTLRFEAGMPLYGQELDKETSPLEARLNRFVALDKEEHFIGKEALKKRLDEGLKKRLVGLEMLERAIPRSHYKIAKEGQEIGEVTTGSYSPTLERNIAMAYVTPGNTKLGTEVDVMIRNKARKAKIIKLPFYRRPR